MAGLGIVYVATKHDRYVEEAFLSAESAKARAPELSITLFTDRPENPLCATRCFDRIEPVEGVDGFRSDWAEGQLNRLRALPRTPYERTLHLDTDTRIATRALVKLFARLDAIDVAMVEDPPDNSYAARHSGRAMFNAGFILYRRTDAVWRWLEQWAAATEANFRLAAEPDPPPPAVLAHIADAEIRRNLLRMDQISLMELLSPDVNRVGLAVKTLDPSWNYRGSRLLAFRRAKIDIHHSSAFKKTTHADILAVAAQWAEAGRDDEAERLYAYVGATLQSKPAKRSGWRILARDLGGKDAPAADPPTRRGELHRRSGQFAQATRYFTLALSRDPGNGAATLGLAQIALRSGRLEEAIALAESALERTPKSDRAQAALGEALVIVGRPVDAIPPLVRAAAAGNDGAAFLLGQARFALKDYGKASSAYRRALELNPKHAGAANNLLLSLLGEGKYAATVEHADRLLAEQPWHAAALAFKCLALAELGRLGELAALADHGRYVVAEMLSPPPGFGAMDEFNRALAKAMGGEKSLVYEPAGHTTRFGLQSGDLADSPSPAIQALNTAIMDAVRARIDAIAPGDLPFEKNAPREFRFFSWATVLDEQGHQAPHIHSSGWMSGVYYVEVPDAVMADEAGRQGWLTFGRGDERWQRPATAVPEHSLCPRPGLLVTFPSYFWHGTRPLVGRARRISYAFDIVPE